MTHLMLVEDDGDTRSLMENVLRREGFEAHSAATAERALELLGASGAEPVAPFDLILTDLKLGAMDGATFAQAVWALHPRMGVAILSGYRGAGLPTLGSDPRLLAFFEKPVYDLRGMANALKAALERYRQRATS